MNEIISKTEYENLLRKTLKAQVLSVAYIMLSISFVEVLVIIYFSMKSEEGLFNLDIGLMISFVIFLSVAGIFFLISKHYDKKEIPHFSFQQYLNHVTNGIKVPMYRYLQRGKNKQTIFVLMDINHQDIKFYDHRKKGLQLLRSGSIDDVRFQFYYKSNQNMDLFKKKIDVYINDKKIRFYGFIETYNDIIEALKTYQFKIEIK